MQHEPLQSVGVNLECLPERTREGRGGGRCCQQWQGRGSPKPKRKSYGIIKMSTNKMVDVVCGVKNSEGGEGRVREGRILI